MCISKHAPSYPDHRYFKRQACASGSILASSAPISKEDFSNENLRNNQCLEKFTKISNVGTFSSALSKRIYVFKTLSRAVGSRSGLFLFVGINQDWMPLSDFNLCSCADVWPLCYRGVERNKGAPKQPRSETELINFPLPLAL